MRKILLGLLLAALLTIFGVMVINGIDVGGLRLGYSVQEIINENDNLDTAIATLSTNIDTEYQSAKDNLDFSFKRLQNEKQNYQTTIAYSTEEEIKAANETEQYRLDYLWTTIGLYATKHNLVMRSDFSHGTSGVQDQYNISFTVRGEYLSVSEFVYEIEKDPTLGFRIEEFALVPYSDTELQGTFLIKNVPVDPSSLSASATISTGTITDNINGSQNSNITNSNTQGTNTLNNTNTTNITNTSSR